MNSHKEKLDDVFKKTCIVGYSTSFSVIIYGLIAYFLLSKSSRSQSYLENIELTKQIAWGVCFSIAVSASLLKRMLIRKMRMRKLDVDQTINQLRVSSMVTYGMCESIALIGLVVAVISRNINDYYGLAFFSLMSFAILFPKYHLWDRVIRQSAYFSDAIDK